MKLEVKESTNRLKPQESTSKIESNESTSKSVSEETTSKIESNESTSKLELKESTNKKEPEESTSQIKQEESSSKIANTEYISNSSLLITQQPTIKTSYISNIEHSTNLKEHTQKVTLITSIIEKPETTTISAPIINKTDHSFTTQNFENNIQTTSIVSVTNENLIIFLGFNHLQNLLSKIVFYIYVGVLKGYFLSPKVKIPVEINKSKLLRFLQTYEADCTLEEGKYNYLSYSCEVPAKIDKLNNLKMAKEFQFSSILPNTTFIISPLIEIFMDNILEVEDKFYNLFTQNLSLYVLEKSQINECEKQNFNISGIIYDKKPNFKKINFTLTSKAEINKEECNAELNCSIINIIDNNYTLNCQGDKDITYNFQYSLAIIDDEMLLLKFDENENATFSIDMGNSKTSTTFLYKNSKTKNIILIVIIIIVAIIAVLTAIIVTAICLRKLKQENNMNSESTIIDLKG